MSLCEQRTACLPRCAGLISHRPAVHHEKYASILPRAGAAWNHLPSDPALWLGMLGATRARDAGALHSMLQTDPPGLFLSPSLHSSEAGSDTAATWRQHKPLPVMKPALMSGKAGLATGSIPAWCNHAWPTMAQGIGYPWLCGGTRWERSSFQSFLQCYRDIAKRHSVVRAESQLPFLATEPSSICHLLGLRRLGLSEERRGGQISKDLAE